MKIKIKIDNIIHGGCALIKGIIIVKVNKAVENQQLIVLFHCKMMQPVHKVSTGCIMYFGDAYANNTLSVHNLCALPLNE